MFLFYNNLQHLLPTIIEGKVINLLKKPIGNVQVYFINSKETATTTNDGTFKIVTWTPLPTTLIFCHKKYEKETHSITSITKKMIVTLKEK
jgi:uncharacterized protein YjlB